FASHVGCSVDDLSLQIGVVHDIEVNNPQRSYAGRAQIKRHRRTQSARADAQYPGCLEPELTFHADLRHDEMPRVAQDFVVRKHGGFRFDFRDGGHGNLSYDLRVSMDEVNTLALGSAPCDGRNDGNAIRLFYRSGFFLQISAVFV